MKVLQPDLHHLHVLQRDSQPSAHLVMWAGKPTSKGKGSYLSPLSATRPNDTDFLQGFGTHCWLMLNDLYPRRTSHMTQVSQHRATHNLRLVPTAYMPRSSTTHAKSHTTRAPHTRRSSFLAQQQIAFIQNSPSSTPQLRKHQRHLCSHMLVSSGGT